MGARRFVVALLIAFGVTVAIAAATTIRQVQLAASSIPHPTARI
jgi:hypothetical protein